MGDVATAHGGLLHPRVGGLGPRNGARRCLFGVPEPGLSGRLDDALSAILAEDCRKYNFDFGAGVPLPGRFEWMKATDDAVVPSGKPDEGGGRHDSGGERLPVQTQITDYLRKRKSSCEGKERGAPKKRRRAST